MSDIALRLPSQTPLVVLAASDVLHMRPDDAVAHEYQVATSPVIAHVFRPGEVRPVVRYQVHVLSLTDALEEWDLYLRRLAAGSAVDSGATVPLETLARIADGTLPRHIMVDEGPPTNAPIPLWSLSDEARAFHDRRIEILDSIAASRQQYAGVLHVVTPHAYVTTDVAWQEARAALRALAPELEGHEIVPEYVVPDGMENADLALAVAEQTMSTATTLAGFREAATTLDRVITALHQPRLAALNASRLLVGELDPTAPCLWRIPYYQEALAGRAPLPSECYAKFSPDAVGSDDEMASAIESALGELDSLAIAARTDAATREVIALLTSLLPFGRIFPRLPIGLTLHRVEMSLQG